MLCTLTVGEGLNKICQAVKEELDRKNIENEIFNVFENNPKRAKAVSASYYKLVKILGKTMRFFQHKTCNYNRKLNKTRNCNYIKNDIKALAEILPKKVNEGNFDVIFTPVSSIAISATLLNRKNIIKTKVIYNVPDFNIPVYTEMLSKIDAVISPCKEVTQNLLKANFKPNMIYEYGIPIQNKYKVNYDKFEIRKKLDIPENKFVVMMMGGGAGFSQFSKNIKVFEKYSPEHYYIIVNGKNEKEKNKIDKVISKYHYTNVKNLGFCTNVDELMSASDVLFSKVGSATTCEAFAKKLVIVTTEQILYPEYDNLLHLKKYNAAKQCKTIKECCSVFNELAKNHDALKTIRENFLKIYDINANQKIAEVIANLK